MQYRMLGPFEVLDGETSVHLGGGRQRAFLVLLLLNANQVVSTDRIIDQLWGDEVPETVSNVIQVYVSRLRKALEPDRVKGAESSVLLTRRPGYMLKVSPEQIDAHRFEELLTRGREALGEGATGIAATQLSQALDLWNGDVLADLAFEDFARADIERLSEARLVCLENLHEAQLALGQHEELVGQLETLVNAHPLREQLWAQLMTALYRSGRQAEALRAYRRAADILVEELGIDPGPHLQELEELILMQDPSLDAPLIERQALPVTSPQDPPPLIGRTHQMAALADAFGVLGNGRSLLMTVDGDHGMGVSRLLAEVQRSAEAAGIGFRMARAFPTSRTQPGDVLDQLGDLEGSSPLVVAIANARDADPTSLAALRRALVGAERPLLVVLGRTKRTDRGSVGMERLIQQVESAATVIPLEVGRVSVADCEQVMPVELAAYVMNLSDGYPYDIAQLLVGLRNQGAVEWDTSTVRLKGSVPEEAVPSLGRRVKDLPAERRRLVEACALAGIPIPLAAASRIMNQTEAEALEAIEDLVAQGILIESTEGVEAAPDLGSGRLTERMGQTRRTAVYGDLADALTGLAPDQSIGWFALRANDLDRAADLLSNAGLVEVNAGNYEEAQSLLEGAIEAKERAGSVGDPLWGRLHLGLAECQRLGGWSDLAMEAAQEAIAHVEDADLVDALGWAAQIADDQQNVAASEWWVARAERAAILDGASEKLGSLLSLRARVLNRLAFADESDVCAEKADELVTRFAGPRQRYLSSYNRAWIAFDRGRMREAESRFAALADQTKADGRLADVSAWHGRALFAMGRVDEARQALGRAEDLGRRTGDGGPVFLALLGRAEGALSFGVEHAAAVAVAEFTGMVMHQFPSWENIARYLAARHAWLRGEEGRAADEVANSLELSSFGPSGRRWWLAARALQMRIEGEDSEVLDRLLDEARAAQWHGAELALLGWAAEKRRDPVLAAECVELGLEHGLHVAAVRAARYMDTTRPDLEERLQSMIGAHIAGNDPSWTEGLLARSD